METINYNKFAKKIGTQEALFALATAFCIDIAIILYNWSGQFLETYSILRMSVFAACMLLFGPFFGRIAAVAIIVRKQSFALVGIGCAYLVLALSTLCTCFLALCFENGWDLTSPRMTANLFEYTIGAVLIVSIYSSVVIIPHGIIFGYRIRQKGMRHA